MASSSDDVRPGTSTKEGVQNLTLNEITDYLETDTLLLDSDDSENEIHLACLPPREKGNAMSDEDSDESDAETTGNLCHLPRRVLGAEAIVTGVVLDKPITQPPPSKKERKIPSKRKWKSLDKYNVSITKAAKKNETITASTPIEFLKLFLTQELIEEIVSESNKYALQSGNENHNITAEELLGVFGVMMLTGYRDVPNKKHLWSNKDDLGCTWVKDLMPRNRFFDLLKYLHFADNTQLTSDRYYKVRPLFEKFNNACKSLKLTTELSIDETMVPYFGRHGTKQFIKGKPIRYGYKLFCLASSSGFLYHAEPYCGSDTSLPDTGLGQGVNVVLGLLEKAHVSEGHFCYFDNFFISLKLLDELSARSIGGTGTIRDNRTEHAPLTDKRTFQKKRRGAAESVTDGTNALVRWNDNKVVTVGTNCIPLEPSATASRYSRIEHKRVSVTMPNPVYQYNQHMGVMYFRFTYITYTGYFFLGVDLFDQFVSNYRCGMRGKKWWWPLFQWVIDASRTNAWLAARRVLGDIPQLPFLREITEILLKQNSIPQGMPRYSGKENILDTLRYDGANHWPQKMESRFHRCRVCSGRTNLKCSKCNVTMHIECFKKFHFKERNK